ncbi:hypothetical protein H2200_000027 [Cladophialophora chaetospira]|uniref:Uncharacterized protein n=1 Tax=Cladophialophora chaetospira TaxID=386627 RepID=A0AA38XMS3_9EURO|nr:hypothetical protein H2200_000027 [Cladophialophora chaetospira]
MATMASAKTTKSMRMAFSKALATELDELMGPGLDRLFERFKAEKRRYAIVRLNEAKLKLVEALDIFVEAVEAEPADAGELEDAHMVDNGMTGSVDSKNAASRLEHEVAKFEETRKALL